MSDDDSGGLVSEIADIAGDVGGAVVDEFKKFGKSATSQVTGGSGVSTSDLAKTAKSAGKANSQPVADHSHSFLDELKKFGGSAVSQVTGHEQEISGTEVKAMAKKDDAFSKQESAAVVAKINQIYAQYAAKKAQEKQQTEGIEKQQEEVKEEQEKVIKKEETNAAIQKTRVEIKNYGAE